MTGPDRQTPFYLRSPTRLALAICHPSAIHPPSTRHPSICLRFDLAFVFLSSALPAPAISRHGHELIHRFSQFWSFFISLLLFLSFLAGSPGPIFLRYPLSTFPRRSPPSPPLLTTPPCVVDGRCSKTLSRPDFSQSREYSSLSFLDLDLDNLENTARPTHLIPLSSYLCSSLASCKESSGHSRTVDFDFRDRVTLRLPSLSPYDTSVSLVYQACAKSPRTRIIYIQQFQPAWMHGHETTRFQYTDTLA